MRLRSIPRNRSLSIIVRLYANLWCDIVSGSAFTESCLQPGSIVIVIELLLAGNQTWMQHWRYVIRVSVLRSSNPSGCVVELSTPYFFVMRWWRKPRTLYNKREVNLSYTPSDLNRKKNFIAYRTLCRFSADDTTTPNFLSLNVGGIVLLSRLHCLWIVLAGKWLATTIFSIPPTLVVFELSFSYRLPNCCCQFLESTFLSSRKYGLNITAECPSGLNFLSKL